MRYDDIMTAPTPYFTYMFRGDSIIFFYNFIPASVDIQTYICILPDSTLGTLSCMDNRLLKTSPDDEVFLEFTDIVILYDVKNTYKISHKDQQKLLAKVQEFRITHPELFI